MSCFSNSLSVKVIYMFMHSKLHYYYRQESCTKSTLTRSADRQVRAGKKCSSNFNMISLRN